MRAFGARFFSCNLAALRIVAMHRLLPLLVLLLSACAPDRPAGFPAGGDFVLQSADGPVDTRALRGKVVLLYFGYTKCPDVCPASMSVNAQALNALDAEARKKTAVLLVSLDPERDTLPVLRQYASFFHPNMVGVTGTPAEVDAAARAYGVGYVKQKPDADGNYAVDHSAQTFVLDPDGRLVEILQLGTTAEKTVAAIRRHLP